MDEQHNNQCHSDNTSQSPRRTDQWKLPVIYSVVFTLLAIAALIYILNLIEQRHHLNTNTIPLTLLVTLVLSGGVIGGCLFNIHSLAKHIDRGDFKKTHNVTYYLCPISGAVCGLIVVILLLGGVLTLGLAEQAGTAVMKHPGKLMPFIAIAIVAGYGSRQFKRKLDEIADTIFKTNEKKVNRPKP